MSSANDNQTPRYGLKTVSECLIVRERTAFQYHSMRNLCLKSFCNVISTRKYLMHKNVRTGLDRLFPYSSLASNSSLAGIPTV